MNKIVKIGILVPAALAVLGASGYGAWYAWDNGKLGDNPRAPTPHAMEKAVRIQATHLARMSGMRQPCLSINFGQASPEINGVRGIGQQSVPGQYALTFLVQTNDRHQQARDLQIAQFNYLAQQGLFSAVDTSITTDDGVARPAKSYHLTWKGYSSLQPNSGSSICLNYGKREFAGIEQIEKSAEKMMDLDVYEVGYKTKVAGVPPWAATEDARRHFPQLADLIGDGGGTAKVIRTDSGWSSAYEIETELNMATKGTLNPQMVEIYRRQMAAVLQEPPPISIEEVRAMVEKQAASPDWLSRNGVACLPLHLQRGGDEKAAQGARDASEFAVTYYDRSDRKPYEYQTMAKSLHVLSALEGAGLAVMEAIQPAPPPAQVKSGRRLAPKSAEPPKPLGIRYKVNPEAMAAMGMTGYGGGCVTAGRMKIEVLSAQESYESTQANVIVRATLEQAPDWAMKIADGLPALKTILENGLPMRGSLYRGQDGSGDNSWKLSGLSPTYPSLSYDSIPAHLKLYMPQTAAAFPGKTVKAPALLPELRARPEPILQVEPGSAAAPAAAPAAPPTILDEAPASVRRPKVTPPPPPLLFPGSSAPSTGPIYAAAGAPVHVVSIYEAPLSDGKKRGFQQHPEGAVSVTVSVNNASLVLFSYEPASWKINAAEGVKLKRILAVGYYEQRILLTGGGKPEVTAIKTGMLAEQLAKQGGIDLSRVEIPRKTDPNSQTIMAGLIQAMTGALPASIQAAYKAPEAGFVIDERTPKFGLPVGIAPPATATPVTLQGIWDKGFIQGYTVLRGSAGAYNEFWTDRAYSAGKAYFEAKLRVTGSLSAHSHANVGLCYATEKGVDLSSSQEVMAIGHNEERLYKNDDLFSLAADLDKQVLYVRVNGKWITGQPGSGSGKRMQAGITYRACVKTSGTTSGDVGNGMKQSDTTWELNFGQKPFAHPIPTGYRPYQGGQV